MESFSGKDEENAAINEAKRLLKSAGFRVEIGGCGCCGSPWVKIEHNGKLIISDGEGEPVDECKFDMFEDE